MRPTPRSAVRAGTTKFSPTAMLLAESDPVAVPMTAVDQIQQVTVDDTPAAISEETQSNPAEDEKKLQDLTADKIGAQIFERLSGWLNSQVAEAKVSYEAFLEQAKNVESKPTVRFWQRRKQLEFPPKALPDGDIALYHNFNPEEATSSEISIGSTGPRVVDFGFRVEVPAGWVADVSTEGVAGQRVVVATLCGSTHKEGTLKLALRNNRPSPVTISAGQEIARLHLRRNTPAVVEWTAL